MANRFLSNISINDAYTFPASDGTNGQVVTTDGSGNLSFSDINLSVSQLSDVQITSVSNGDLLVWNSTGGYWENTKVVQSIQFAGGTGTQGTLSWNSEDETVDLIVSPDVTYQLGQELGLVVRNLSGQTINNGDVVKVVGASGNKVTIDLADNSGEYDSSSTFAVVTETIANNSTGRVTMEGLVRGLDTSTFTEGVAIWLGATGQFTATKPLSPNHLVHVGWVVRSHATEGSIFVKINNGWELEELHDVLITSASDGQLLVWDNTLGVWKNQSLSTIADSRYVNVSGDTMTGDLNVSSGNILIGTDSGDAFNAVSKLRIQQPTSAAYIQIKTANTEQTGLLFGDVDDDFTGGFIYTNVNDKLLIYTNNSANVAIDNLGQVGIGTLSPSRKLEVSGDAYIAGEFLATTNGLVRLNQYDNGFNGAGEIALWSAGGTGWAIEDGLGRIRFYTNDTSGIGARDIAKIEAVSEHGNGTTTTTSSAALAFYTSLQNANVVENMRLSSAGNLSVVGNVTAANLAVSNWNEAYGWGDHADLYLPLTGGTITGYLTIGSATNRYIRFSTATNWYYYLSAINDDFYIKDAQDVNFFKAVYNGGGTGKYAAILDKLYVYNDGKVGIGTTLPSSTLEVSQQLSAVSTIDYPLTISSRDDNNLLNQLGGEGVGIRFRIAGNETTVPGDSLVGASIAAVRESSSDAVSSTALAFFVSQDDETLDEAIRIDSAGSVGINTNLPKAKLDINGTIVFDSKSMSLSDTFATALTVNMTQHTGCYVKITAFGDWATHSAAAYLGEFFIQHGSDAYNEPGTIIRQVDNTNTDSIEAKIVDPVGVGVAKDFTIQLRATSANNTPFTIYLQYEVRGQFNSVS